MIKTHGLNHISLSVADPDRSLAFYRALFGVREYVCEEGSIQAAGAKILRQGEFESGLPYLFLEDPDGYTIEIWYE